MVPAPLFGTAMIIAVATGPLDDPMGLNHLSPRQKGEATETLVQSATDCIVHAVFAGPRLQRKRHQRVRCDRSPLSDRGREAARGR